MIKYFRYKSFKYYLVCRKTAYLSSFRVNGKTIFFINMFLNLLLYMKEINLLFLNELILLKVNSVPNPFIQVEYIMCLILISLSFYFLSLRVKKLKLSNFS